MNDNTLRSLILWGIVVSGVVAGMYLLRISGATDIESYAQDRNVGYVMDAAWRGNWLVQRDIQHRIMSKPPLHTWLAASLARVGGVNRVTLTLPSLLAVLVLSLVVMEAGRRAFGPAAGGFAGLAVALAPMLSKHVALVRTDPLFALAVALAALAAWRAWRRGGGWTLFWLAAAAATLIKGPLGAMLGAAGLLAFFWERRTDPTTPRPRGSHLPGVAIYLGLCLGWFLLAAYASGCELIDKMIVQELFGQATGAHKSASPGQNLPKPVLYFFWHFLPFSALTFVGLWRAIRHPALSDGQRRFERFLTCWILTGLAIFSVAAHHRADLLLPLWPAGALLAGREIARLKEVVGERLLNWSMTAVCAVLVLFAYWTYHVMPARRARVADYSAQVRQAAEALKAADINPDELIHVSTPVTLQMYLGTCKSWVDLDEVRELLARGQSLLLAIGDNKYRNNLLDALTDAFVEELCIWPQDSAHEQGFRLTILQVVPQ